MQKKRIEKKGNVLTILIPVYNEEKTLLKILKTTTELKIGRYEVVIVDDSSSDKSSEIISSFVKEFKSTKVSLKNFRHKVNKGKGAAIQTALKHATGEYFIIQDADLEYDPNDIPSILKRAQKDNLDAVYGSRFTGTIKGMPKANYVANRGYNIILRLLYRTDITDMHTCYKMVRTSLIKKLKITSNGFDYATELVSKLLKSGTTIHEVPISFTGRTKKEGKKIDVMDGVECAYKLVRFRFSKSSTIFSEKSTTFARFIIVGLIGFLTNYTILVFLTHLFGIGHIPAEVVAALIALQVTFILHDRWTYKLHTPAGTEKLKLKARYVAYLISNSFGSISTVIIFSLIYSYMTRLTALLVAAIAGVCWNYLMNTYVIWSRNK